MLAGDDSRLIYREMPGLAPWLLDTHMAVLSACESGLPVTAQPTMGDDGAVIVSIERLPAQFQRAGVQPLVASLCKVDDDATEALMTAFYDHLAAGNDVADASPPPKPAYAPTPAGSTRGTGLPLPSLETGDDRVDSPGRSLRDHPLLGGPLRAGGRDQR